MNAEKIFGELLRNLRELAPLITDYQLNKFSSLQPPGVPQGIAVNVCDLPLPAGASKAS